MSAALPACWRTEDARSIFVTEALEGDDAIFLATHTAIVGFDVSGSEAAEVQGNDERALLKVLSEPSRQHAFCVVQGEPGSGKSHLIRWLSVNWPDNRDIKLLLRRADGSLEGALSQLRKRLPDEFGPLFDNIGRRQRATAQGRANIFLSTLANTLEAGHFDIPLPDDGWCQVYWPSDLLSHPAVKAKWKAPSRILNLIDGAHGERGSATASFDLYDILELAELCEPLQRSSGLSRCQDLIKRIVRDADVLRGLREEGWLADEIVAEQSERFTISLKFANALNLRRNDAIQNVLGVSAQGLKTLFRQLREALAERGQRLVLLLEDITSWEGLDDSLIDVLVFNAAVKGERDERPVCPLISVVGVTPHYYERLQGNYRQRITHEVKLGRSTEGLQDVTTLRSRENRLAFAARYLNAVRVGPTRLSQWFSTLEAREAAQPPNACSSCPRQTKCFEIFGETEETGLFPFTEHAFDRFFQALKENDNGQTWRTPRGILQAILSPNLLQPDSLARGAYPGAFVEPDPLRPERRSNKVLAPRLEEIVVNNIEAPEEQARMRRMLAYWGDPDRSSTTMESGQLAFAGTKRAVYEAFGLPWIGGSEPTNVGPATIVTDAPVSNATETARTEGTSPGLDPEYVKGSRESPPTGGLVPQKHKPAPKPKRLMPTKTEIEKLREEIRNWSVDGGIENASGWNGVLYSLSEFVDPRKCSVPNALFKRLVTPEMVKLEGSTTRALDYLMIPDAPWVRKGLEAYITLKQNSKLDDDDAGFYRRHLATMMRNLEKTIDGYLSRKIPQLDNGRRWSPVVTFAQVLLVRAYLRGETTPTAPLSNQIRAVLSDEGVSETHFTARCAPWQEWLNATKNAHDVMRHELREMVSLGLADGPGGAALTDASELVGSIIRLRDSGQLDPLPAGHGGLSDPFKRALEIAQLWQEKRRQVERVEYEQVQKRSNALSQLLRGNGISAHLDRLDRCISDIATFLPGAGTDKVTAWKLAYDRLKQRLSDGICPRVEDLIIALEGGQAPVDHLQRLGWLAKAPVGDLEELLNTVQLGERAVETLHVHARDCVAEASGTASLDDIKEIGRALKAAAHRITKIETPP